MKKIGKVGVGLIGLLFFVSSLLRAESDREMLVKRWKVVKHIKLGKQMPLAEDDFIQFTNDGVYEQALNRYYARGSWAINADNITVNNNGEYNWKVVSVSLTTMSLARGADEVMELEVIKMPAPTNATTSSRVRYLCMGKWRPNEHHKADVAIKFLLSDLMVFYTDGSFDQILNGVYSKGKWNFNKDETELTINAITWKVDGLSALFFKLTKMPESNEFIVFAKTR